MKRWPAPHPDNAPMAEIRRGPFSACVIAVPTAVIRSRCQVYPTLDFNRVVVGVDWAWLNTLDATEPAATIVDLVEATMGRHFH